MLVKISSFLHLSEHFTKGVGATLSLSTYEDSSTEQIYPEGQKSCQIYIPDLLYHFVYNTTEENKTKTNNTHKTHCTHQNKQKTKLKKPNT